MVWSIRSVFTLAATTGPLHSRRAGTAKPDVLWDWVGPKTMTDWARSAATRRFPARPSTRRPGGGTRPVRPTVSARRSPGAAHRAGDLGRGRPGPGSDRGRDPAAREGGAGVGCRIGTRPR